MSTHSEKKLKNMLTLHQQGTVALAAWLEQQGISRDLQKRYRRSGWLESLGRGAFKRPDDEVHWQGALYALQMQAKLPFHVGAVTALTLQGLSHYLRLGAETVFLFSPQKINLPAWFRSYDWHVNVQHIRTSLLPAYLGLVDHKEKSFTLRIASPERAIIECLHLAPDSLDLVECYQILEGLGNLRPKLLQSLLEACTSIQVKRLFLYMAEKANHQWVPFLDESKINLGNGDRSLAKGGVYIPRHRITVPKALAAL